eukprot:2485472-Pyramimonas_sp.AAC.1
MQSQQLLEPRARPEDMQSPPQIIDSSPEGPEHALAQSFFLEYAAAQHFFGEDGFPEEPEG